MVTHYSVGDGSPIAACGVRRPRLMTRLPLAVNCARCRKTTTEANAEVRAYREHAKAVGPEAR
jgi:hypothetical protein